MYIVYATDIMAKRDTGVGNNKTSRSKKTAKRLAKKFLMLEEKAKSSKSRAYKIAAKKKNK